MNVPANSDKSLISDVKQKENTYVMHSAEGISFSNKNEGKPDKILDPDFTDFQIDNLKEYNCLSKKKNNTNCEMCAGKNEIINQASMGAIESADSIREHHRQLSKNFDDDLNIDKNNEDNHKDSVTINNMNEPLKKFSESNIKLNKISLERQKISQNLRAKEENKISIEKSFVDLAEGLKIPLDKKFDKSQTEFFFETDSKQESTDQRANLREEDGGYTDLQIYVKDLAKTVAAAKHDTNDPIVNVERRQSSVDETFKGSTTHILQNDSFIEQTLDLQLQKDVQNNAEQGNNLNIEKQYCDDVRKKFDALENVFENPDEFKKSQLKYGGAGKSENGSAVNPDNDSDIYIETTTEFKLKKYLHEASNEKQNDAQTSSTEYNVQGSIKQSRVDTKNNNLLEKNFNTYEKQKTRDTIISNEAFNKSHKEEIEMDQKEKYEAKLNREYKNNTYTQPKEANENVITNEHDEYMREENLRSNLRPSSEKIKSEIDETQNFILENKKDKYLKLFRIEVPAKKSTKETPNNSQINYVESTEQNILLNILHDTYSYNVNDIVIDTGNDSEMKNNQDELIKCENQQIFNSIKNKEISSNTDSTALAKDIILKQLKSNVIGALSKSEEYMNIAITANIDSVKGTVKAYEPQNKKNENFNSVTFNEKSEIEKRPNDTEGQNQIDYKLNSLEGFSKNTVQTKEKYETYRDLSKSDKSPVSDKFCLLEGSSTNKFENENDKIQFLEDKLINKEHVNNITSNIPLEINEEDEVGKRIDKTKDCIPLFNSMKKASKFEEDKITSLLVKDTVINILQRASSVSVNETNTTNSKDGDNKLNATTLKDNTLSQHFTNKDFSKNNNQTNYFSTSNRIFKSINETKNICRTNSDSAIKYNDIELALESEESQLKVNKGQNFLITKNLEELLKEFSEFNSEERRCSSVEMKNTLNYLDTDQIKADGDPIGISENKTKKIELKSEIFQPETNKQKESLTSKTMHGIPQTKSEENIYTSFEMTNMLENFKAVKKSNNTDPNTNNVMLNVVDTEPEHNVQNKNINGPICGKPNSEGDSAGQIKGNTDFSQQIKASDSENEAKHNFANLIFLGNKQKVEAIEKKISGVCSKINKTSKSKINDSNLGKMVTEEVIVEHECQQNKVMKKSIKRQNKISELSSSGEKFEEYLKIFSNSGHKVGSNKETDNKDLVHEPSNSLEVSTIVQFGSKESMRKNQTDERLSENCKIKITEKSAANLETTIINPEIIHKSPLALIEKESIRLPAEELETQELNALSNEKKYCETVAIGTKDMLKDIIQQNMANLDSNLSTKQTIDNINYTKKEKEPVGNVEGSSLKTKDTEKLIALLNFEKLSNNETDQRDDISNVRKTSKTLPSEEENINKPPQEQSQYLEFVSGNKVEVQVSNENIRIDDEGSLKYFVKVCKTMETISKFQSLDEKIESLESNLMEKFEERKGVEQKVNSNKQHESNSPVKEYLEDSVPQFNTKANEETKTILFQKEHAQQSNNDSQNNLQTLHTNNLKQFDDTTMDLIDPQQNIPSENFTVDGILLYEKDAKLYSAPEDKYKNESDFKIISEKFLCERDIKSFYIDLVNEKIFNNDIKIFNKNEELANDKSNARYFDFQNHPGMSKETDNFGSVMDLGSTDKSKEIVTYFQIYTDAKNKNDLNLNENAEKSVNQNENCKEAMAYNNKQDHSSLLCNKTGPVDSQQILLYVAHNMNQENSLEEINADTKNNHSVLNNQVKEKDEASKKLKEHTYKLITYSPDMVKNVEQEIRKIKKDDSKVHICCSKIVS